jgi:hypothetical protein
MSGYSEESLRRAEQIAEKAAQNLRKTGNTVSRTSDGGWKVVRPKGGRASDATSRDASTGRIIGRA